MKLIKILCILFTALWLPAISRAQTTQSALNDAIALMNASHGVNALFTANPHGFNVIDPLTGQVVANNVTATPAANLDPHQSPAIIFAILARNAGLSGTDSAGVRAAYANNPFLKDILSTASLKIAPDNNLATYGTIITSGQSGSILQSIGGNVVNGVADLIEKKAMEEISVSVFQKLKNFLANYPEFNVLFPRTVALLQPVQAYDYAKTLKSLKAALQQDLNNLPAHIPWLYSLQRYQLLNAKVPELTLLFASSQLFNELHGKSSLGRSLHDLDTAAFLKAPNNYAAVIRLVELSSTSLRKKLISDSENDDYPYFTANDIKLATHGQPGYMTELGKFYLGLLYQQTAALQFYDQNGAHAMADLIAPYTTSTADILNKLIGASDQLNSLEQQLLTLKQRDDNLKMSGKNVVSADRFTLYNSLLVTSMQVVAPFVSDAPSGQSWKVQVSAIITYWPQFSASGIQMIRDVSDRNYNLAVADLSGMLNNLSAYLAAVKTNKTQQKQLSAELSAQLKIQIDADSTRLANITTTISALPATGITDPNVKASVALQLQSLTQQKAMLTTGLQNLRWESTNGKAVFGNFARIVELFDLLASLSQAGDSQEVESILENYVLPAGSSRVKKETAFNISLNAYAGGFYRPSATGTGYTNKFGLTAPVGFDFSTGLGHGGSFSLFLGVVDIGGVIQYKLNNQNQYEQNINFAGLVSPGIHFVYGFAGYLPISIGLGCQWTSPVTAPTGNISLQPHFNCFLAIDVPLFNLCVVKHKGS